MSRPETRPLTEFESANLIENQEEAIKAHVQHLVQVITAAAKEARTPPGVAVMGGCDFIAVMLHFNIPESQHSEELSRLMSYIKDRLKELSNATTH